MVVVRARGKWQKHERNGSPAQAGESVAQNRAGIYSIVHQLAPLCHLAGWKNWMCSMSWQGKGLCWARREYTELVLPKIVSPTELLEELVTSFLEPILTGTSFAIKEVQVKKLSLCISQIPEHCAGHFMIHWPLSLGESRSKSSSSSFWWSDL